MTVRLKAVVSSVANSVLVGSVLIAYNFVPESEIAVKIEVLDNLWVLAAASVDSSLSGDCECDGRNQ